MVNPDKWLIDNTVLSNFALIDQLRLLSEFLRDKLLVTQEVKNEFLNGINAGKLPEGCDIEWINIISFKDTKEQNMFIKLCERFGKGESSILSIAINRKWKIITDDIDARKMAQREEIAVTGSIGLLVYLIKKGNILLTDGNRMLEKMIKAGYFSPINSLNNLL